jgi:hypothetical protein
MVILRATNDNGVKADLDVLENDAPIKLDISAVENATIGNVFGASSQTFSLPGTDRNNAFFGNLFDLGTTPAVALQDSIDCQVLTDGQEVFTGKLYITDIITDQKGYTTYQVNVVNETIDFKFLLTDTIIGELDFSAFNHAYTYGNITSSWEGNLLSGSIVYPHVNYGTPAGDTTLPSFQFGGGPRNFDNFGFPLQVTQFKPAIKVKDVLDVIFDSVNYKYTSSFIDSEYFNNIYLLTTSNDGLGAYNANPVTGSVWAFRGGSNQTLIPALTATKINFTNEVYDDFNRFDLINDRYTAYADGLYNFAVGFNFSVVDYGINNRTRLRITLRKNGTSVGPTKNFVNIPESGQVYAPFANIQLKNNDYVEAFVELFTDDGTETLTIGFGQNVTYFKAEGPASTNLSSVDMAQQFPIQMRALEFIQGLIEKFNLVVEPISGFRNLLRIEPFQDWVDLGIVKDWTDKVDRSQRFKIVHPITEQPKVIYFRDEDDEAVNNKYTTDNFGDVFGTYIYSNESDLCIGEREIGTTFAATPVKGIDGGDQIIIPHLCRRDDTGREIPFAFKPRLLFANGLITSSQAAGLIPTSSAPGDCYSYRLRNGSGITNLTYSFTDCLGNVSSSQVLPPDGQIEFCGSTKPVRTGGSTQVFITTFGPCNVSGSNPSPYPGYYFIEDEGGVVYNENRIFQMTTFEYLPTDASGSINNSRDLHFGNLNWYQYFQTVQNGKTVPDAYTQYWATYINSLYDIDARKLTCNVYIKPTEIQDIQLNDKIFIDGHYYRINKINGANLTYRDSVEVELIKELNRQLQFPRRRVLDSIGTAVDIIQREINTDGSVIYEYYDGGATVEDFGQIKQAAIKDQYQVFNLNGTGSVTYNLPASVTADQDRIAFGNNQLEDSVGMVLVAGNNNTVQAQTRNSFINGESNVLNAGSTNATIIGVNNTIDVLTENITILGALDSTVTGPNNNSVIIGGTGSLLNNTDWAVMINGYNADIIDSDNTVAINSHDQEVIVNGSGHTVIGLNLEGAGLDLLNTRNNSNWLGDTYIGEALFRTQKVLSIDDGDAIDLSDNQYKHDSLFILDWTGLSPATASITLPNAVNDDYTNITYTFVTTGSFVGSNGGLTEVYLQGFSGQKINGQDSYIIKNPYQAVVLTTTGNGWITLQDNVTNTYGAFYATGSQTIAATGTQQAIILNDGWENYSISISGSSKLVIENPGTYQLIANLQVNNLSSGVEDFVVWLKFNGTNWPFSSKHSTLPARKSAGVPSAQVVTITFVGTSQAPNDYVELFMAASSTDVSIDAYAGDDLGAGEPAAPSISVMITPVS